MNMAAAASVSFRLLPLAFLAILPSLHAATFFTIVNQCNFTVWPAAVPFGGGTQLFNSQIWVINAPSGTTGRIWARTGCSFNASGNFNCQTGDCGGKLACTAYGSPPNTIAEYFLNPYANLSYYDISNVDGYNVGLEFSPETPSGSSCRDIRCADDIIGQCPAELKAPGGCNNACTVFKTDEYCCNSGNNCGPTNYSNFFKFICPDAYSSPKDYQSSSSFTCPAGTNFTVTFCPPD